MLKENIVPKLVHRFVIDSLKDLLIHVSSLREYLLEEENQKQIILTDEVDEEENQEQFKFEITKTFENIEKINGNQIVMKLLKVMEYLAKIKILVI